MFILCKNVSRKTQESMKKLLFDWEILVQCCKQIISLYFHFHLENNFIYYIKVSWYLMKGSSAFTKQKPWQQKSVLNSIYFSFNKKYDAKSKVMLLYSLLIYHLLLPLGLHDFHPHNQKLKPNWIKSWKLFIKASKGFSFFFKDFLPIQTLCWKKKMKGKSCESRDIVFDFKFITFIPFFATTIYTQLFWTLLET